MIRSLSSVILTQIRAGECNPSPDDSQVVLHNGRLPAVHVRNAVHSRSRRLAPDGMLSALLAHCIAGFVRRTRAAPRQLSPFSHHNRQSYWDAPGRGAMAKPAPHHRQPVCPTENRRWIFGVSNSRLPLVCRPDRPARECRSHGFTERPDYRT